MEQASNVRSGKAVRAATTRSEASRGARAKKVPKKAKAQARAKAKRKASPAGPKSLSALIRAESDVLIASATAGGLCDARARSIPSRVRIEAERFLSLLDAALRRTSKAVLEERVRDEIRCGALAAASPGEVEVVFDVWRRTLSSFAASRGRRAVPDHRISSAMDKLECLALEEARRWSDERCDVIVLGASAGGLYALQDTLSSLSDDLPATVLIVQHVSAKAPSLMPVILSRSCDLTVAHAVEGARLFLGHVFVAPPGRHLAVLDDRIHLSDAPPVRHSKPSADVLFESAARIYGRHVVSVVLSGSDHDGANGSRAVRDAGGLVMAQHPGSAQFPAMPESAIATGSVDLVVALHLMGKVIEKIVREGRSAVLEVK